MASPRGHRRWAILGVLLGAPVTAELLQAYLDVTGDPGGLVVTVLFLAPLYGGAALLVREIAVRTGRGWPGILLLAGAFGLAMPGLVDLSLFTEHNPDVTDWDAMWAPTEAFGMSWHPAVAWTLGHVVMSVGVPLAMLDALAPATRERSLLGRPGIVATAALCVAVAALIRADAPAAADPTWVQTAGVVAVVLGLVVLALSPYGTPLGRTRTDRGWPVTAAGVLGFATMVAIDFPPPTWVGVSVVGVAATLLGAVLWRAARSLTWDLRHVTALACAAMLERVLVGFISPLPPGVELASKLAQSAVLLLAVLAVSRLALRRSAAAARRGRVTA
jgi:hypothetical protein